jgi:hypothetical protein
MGKRTYKEVGGRIFVRDDNKYAGSQSLAGREGAPKIKKPVWPAPDLHEGVIEWGSSIEEAHALFEKNREKLFNAARTTPQSTSTTEVSQSREEIIEEIKSSVITATRPTLLPFQHRVYLGQSYGGGLSKLYMDEEGVIAVRKPLYNVEGEPITFKTNIDNINQAYADSELDPVEYDFWKKTAIRTANKAWENHEVGYGEGNIIPRRIKVELNKKYLKKQEDDFDGNRDGFDILELDGTVRTYLGYSALRDEIIRFEDVDTEEGDEVLYIVIGKWDEPKVQARYEVFADTQYDDIIDEDEDSIFNEPDKLVELEHFVEASQYMWEQDPFGRLDTLPNLRYGYARPIEDFVKP